MSFAFLFLTLVAKVDGRNSEETFYGNKLLFQQNCRTMGFIKHALIGIALYEAVKYLLEKTRQGKDFVAVGPQVVAAGRQQLRSDDVDIIADARQTDHLQRMKENAAGTDPETPLIGEDPARAADDPWKKSLANDDLRAPDS